MGLRSTVFAESCSSSPTLFLKVNLTLLCTVFPWKLEGAEHLTDDKNSLLGWDYSTNLMIMVIIPFAMVPLSEELFPQGLPSPKSHFLLMPKCSVLN